MRTVRMAVAVAVTVATSIGMVQGPSEVWRARNDKGDRYEGLNVNVDVANPKIELLSFLAQPVPATVHSTTLQLFFFTPHVAPVHVWARARDLKSGYWMEPKPPSAGWKPMQWNAFCNWKTAGDLDGIALSPTNFGVIARLDDEHPRSGMLAPVLVTAKGQPLPDKITEYEAAFRLGLSSAVISYSITAGCSGFDRKGGETEGLKNGGNIFSIKFKMPEIAGQASLVITATSPDDGSVLDQRRFCFVHSQTVPPACQSQ